ncbi:aftiphilin a [Aplochiton taeniatus]
MEPDVIRLYSSSPPPMEDGAEEEEDEFGDFGGFSGVPNSVSFTEFDTPATFNQSLALAATSPPELLNNGGGVGFSNPSSGNGTQGLTNELSKSNGVGLGGGDDDSLSERTVNNDEFKKQADPSRHTKSMNLSVSGQTNRESINCNSAVPEVLTNGFSSVMEQRTSLFSNSVHCDKEGTTMEEADTLPQGSEGGFADFAVFVTADTIRPPAQETNTNENLDMPDRANGEADDACQSHCTTEQGITKGNVRDAHTTESNLPTDFTEALDSFSNRNGGFHIDVESTKQRDVPGSLPVPASVFTEEDVTTTTADLEESEKTGNGLSSDGEGGGADEKGSGNETETETETETSLGRPLSTDALEEYGDASTTGSLPSPPLQEDTPADHSQLAEDEDQDFGDFGDATSLSGQGFVDFDPPQTQEANRSTDPPSSEPDEEDDFGDFDTPEVDAGATEDNSKFGGFPGSDSFADFSSAPVDADEGSGEGWYAFSELEQGQKEEESWAAFEEVPSAAPLEKSEGEWQEKQAGTAPPALSDQADRRDSHSELLCSKLEKLFQTSFPETPVPSMVEEVEVLSLKTLLGPSERLQPDQEDKIRVQNNGALRDMWWQLQDIHEAYGLRYQWGGSHSNKTLLCSLGIDIRNILFTGQKKQPVIVPMYAASLGMLEPTKEPVKPVSAAEMITSIAQAPPVSPETSTSPDTAQETLPPVQFDWSTSGLTNPLDASGGSSLLNLDFFGPVEDSGSSSSTSIPGVDPELYELTTAKLDPGGSGSRVADAFARLMSTMEKTSTSTRKPRREENLSEEAAKVIASLPDLSFMQAKVLMFPTTLTPLGCTDPTSN